MSRLILPSWFRRGIEPRLFAGYPCCCNTFPDSWCAMSTLDSSPFYVRYFDGTSSSYDWSYTTPDTTRPLEFQLDANGKSYYRRLAAPPSPPTPMTIGIQSIDSSGSGSTTFTPDWATYEWLNFYSYAIASDYNVYGSFNPKHASEPWVQKWNSSGVFQGWGPSYSAPDWYPRYSGTMDADDSGNIVCSGAMIGDSPFYDQIVVLTSSISKSWTFSTSVTNSDMGLFACFDTTGDVICVIDQYSSDSYIRKISSGTEVTSGSWPIFLSGWIPYALMVDESDNVYALRINGNWSKWNSSGTLIHTSARQASVIPAAVNATGDCYWAEKIGTDAYYLRFRRIKSDLETVRWSYEATGEILGTACLPGRAGAFHS